MRQRHCALTFLFSPDNIDPARFVLDFRDRNVDFYVGELDIAAAFLQGQIDITNFINATLGAFAMKKLSKALSRPAGFGDIGSTANLENDYILPAATITWNFADDLQLAPRIFGDNFASSVPRTVAFNLQRSRFRPDLPR